jgi:hypothetical protein
MRQRYGNIGTLDLRSATEETIAPIERIGNVGMILVTPETKPLLATIAAGNIGRVLEVPKTCRLIQGEFQLDHAFFEHAHSLSFIITGILNIADDVTIADLAKIEYLSILGTAICSDGLASALRAYADSIEGMIIPISSGESTRISVGRVVLNAVELATLPVGVEMVIIGELEMTDDIQLDALDRIASINLVGSLTIREEYYRVLGERITRTKEARATIIPEGSLIADQSLTVNEHVLKKLPAKTLYAMNRLFFPATLSPEFLAEHVNLIVAAETVTCPATLYELLLGILRPPHPPIITYKEGVFVVEQEQSMTASTLSRLPVRFTLVVFGVLDFDDDIDADELASRIECVDLLGEITCGEAIYAVIQSKLRTQNGSLVRSDLSSTDDEEPAEYRFIGNIGQLKL